ncbi:MAG: ABC transporter substrate-binding protein, partial [Lachnospiraceae bacterium]|nr:ABC transporter substrate-binding protein [Lachnospiraceae bacterium]
MATSLFAGCGGTGNNGSADGTENNGGSTSKNQVIIGEITETSGDVTPMWANAASDYDVYNMITGLTTVAVTRDGEWVYDEKNVVEKVEETENEDGSKTWTFTIKDGLKFSNGEAINAKNYVFHYLFWGSDELIVDLGAQNVPETSIRYIKGFDAYSAGESEVFEGVHLIDDKTFSLTVDAQFLPYYYGKTLVNATPEYIQGWVPSDVVIEETEAGAKLSDNFTAEYCGTQIEEYRYNPTACSGPYVLTSYDPNSYSYTLTKNDTYPGNFEGQTAQIETVIYKTVEQDTMLDQLKTGAIDILLQCTDGSEISAGFDLVDGGGFNYISYPRTGYGMVSFKCNQGPTQFVEVRQAIMYLLNRTEFAKTFTGGYGSVVNGPYGLSQWMVKEYKEEVEGLNSYAYSLDSAVKLLEEGGWVYDADGNAYAGTGLRHKKLDDGTLMPLSIKWFSSENNSVSDLLVTSLQNNPDLATAGMEIKQTVGTFSELYEYYLDNGEDNPYQMFNLATGFGNPYDVADNFKPGGTSNVTAI